MLGKDQRKALCSLTCDRVSAIVQNCPAASQITQQGLQQSCAEDMVPRMPQYKNPFPSTRPEAFALASKKDPALLHVKRKNIGFLKMWLPREASVYNAGDLGLIPGLGRSTGERNGNPLQYYCLENPMDRGAW